MAETLRLEIVTPDAIAFSGDVEMVTLPGIEGEMGVYPQHEHLITQVVPGEIIVTTTARQRSLAVGEGLVEITAGRVEIVTNMADCRRAHRRSARRRGPRASRRAAAREVVRRGDRLHQRLAGAVAGATAREAPPERVTMAAAARSSGIGALLVLSAMPVAAQTRGATRRPIRSSPLKPSNPPP